jgi:hypothetical protein
MIEESTEASNAAMMSSTGFNHGGTMEVSSKETAGTRVSGQVGTSGNGALERRDVRGAEIAGITRNFEHSSCDWVVWSFTFQLFNKDYTILLLNQLHVASYCPINPINLSKHSAPYVVSS